MCGNTAVEMRLPGLNVWVRVTGIASKIDTREVVVVANISYLHNDSELVTISETFNLGTMTDAELRQIEVTNDNLTDLELAELVELV